MVPPKAIDRLLVSDTVNWDLPQLLALPKVVQVALKKAMEVLAKDRTQSMGELLMQMQNASAGNKQEKPSKEPKPKSEPKSKEGRKSRKKMSRWIPVMVAVLMLVCVVYCVQPVGKTMPTEDQPSQPWLALETPSQPVNRLVACGPNSTVCVTAKDTVLMRGFEKTFPQGGKVRAWKNIVSVSIGETHAIGLRKDGHMVTVGDCNYGTKMTVQYGPSAVVGSPTGEISTNIFDNTVQVEAGNMWTIGLKPDGTVVTAGSESLQEVNTWSNIVAIAAGVDHAVGLKSDGTVVAAGDNFHGKCDVTSWRNIVAISAGRYQTVGLKADGTVVMTGFKDKQDVSSWKNIVAVSAGKYHTVGLMADGTVIATGKNTHHQCEVGSWKNIVAISTGDNHTVGVKSDGTVVATGYNNAGQCDVSAWKNVRISE